MLAIGEDDRAIGRVINAENHFAHARVVATHNKLELPYALRSEASNRVLQHAFQELDKIEEKEKRDAPPKIATPPPATLAPRVSERPVFKDPTWRTKPQPAPRAPTTPTPTPQRAVTPATPPTAHIEEGDTVYPAKVARSIGKLPSVEFELLRLMAQEPDDQKIMQTLGLLQLPFATRKGSLYIHLGLPAVLDGMDKTYRRRTVVEAFRIFEPAPQAPVLRAEPETPAPTAIVAAPVIQKSAPPVTAMPTPVAQAPEATETPPLRPELLKELVAIIDGTEFSESKCLLLALLNEGLDYPAMAERLGTSDMTSVEYGVSLIYKNFGLPSSLGEGRRAIALTAWNASEKSTAFHQADAVAETPGTETSIVAVVETPPSAAPVPEVPVAKLETPPLPADDTTMRIAYTIRTLAAQKRLSARQLELLSYLAQGLEVKEIAARESVSHFTISKQFPPIYELLGIKLPEGRERYGKVERTAAGNGYTHHLTLDEQPFEEITVVTPSVIDEPPEHMEEAPPPPIAEEAEEVVAETPPPLPGVSGLETPLAPESAVPAPEPIPEPAEDEVLEVTAGEGGIDTPPVPEVTPAPAVEVAPEPPQEPVAAHRSSAEEPGEENRLPALIPAQADLGSVITSSSIVLQDRDTVKDAEVLDPRSPSFRRDKLELLQGGYAFEGLHTVVLDGGIISMPIFVLRRK